MTISITSPYLDVINTRLTAEAVCGNGDIADAVLTFDETCLEDVVGDAVRDPYQSVIRIR